MHTKNETLLPRAEGARAAVLAGVLAKPARLVIKVGSSTLTHRTGKLNLGRMEALARELADLANAGHHPVLVTSGAVAPTGQT